MLVLGTAAGRVLCRMQVGRDGVLPSPGGMWLAGGVRELSHSR